jgi:polyribonucleotide nucleotidyltransferase
MLLAQWLRRTHNFRYSFNGPIGAVRVGLVGGQFIINPTYSEMRTA